MAGYIERITGIIPYTNKSVDIQLDGKNLIITGGNGSGKTSFLRAVSDKTVLFIVDKKQADLPDLKQKLVTHTRALKNSSKGTSQYDSWEKSVENIQEEIKKIETGLQPIISNNIEFSSKYEDRQAVVLYFEDKRLADIAVAKTAQGLQSEIEENKKVPHNQNIGSKLEQHLLNMRARRSFAITEDNDSASAKKIDIWFTEFEKNLKQLFEDDSAALHFDSRNNKFSIHQSNKPPYTFQTLSAGYRAIFDIYADLLMRTEYFQVSPAALEGVVFIDEIDSHLHVSLQRLILPFFTESFPNVQFIVTTHSPFVLMSTRDTIVYDLGKEESYTISQAKSQNEILNDYLGVPTAMPVWAEKNLVAILDKYVKSAPDQISFSALKEELIHAGLEEYFPESAAKILESH
ncbi:MAG: AAA family ATPase [Spirochaetaceae bacterium]|jgi:predicted ATP-binding protein involved in virulence|nr:AAA family ATPase [Spirochaetaceae bacterium]